MPPSVCRCVNIGAFFSWQHTKSADCTITVQPARAFTAQLLGSIQGMATAGRCARRSYSDKSPGECGSSTLVPLARFRCVSGVYNRHWCAPETVTTPQSTSLGFFIHEPSRDALLAVSGLLQAGLAARSCALFQAVMVLFSCFHALLLRCATCIAPQNLEFFSQA